MAGISYLGVACLSEALIIRENVSQTFPILVFGERTKEEVPTSVKQNLSLQVNNLDIAQEISHVSQRLHKITNVHLKIDTRMGRYCLLKLALLFVEPWSGMIFWDMVCIIRQIQQRKLGSSKFI